SLAGANGLKTVLAEIRNGSTVLRTSDTIWFEEALKNPAESGGNVLFLPIISKPLVAGEFCGFQ
ncbi:MAG: hypothetical protein R3335_03495, partial [Anaerolineales bacterium]|nr:hypothetical protein [Anaerolineales bacterium]